MTQSFIINPDLFPSFFFLNTLHTPLQTPSALTNCSESLAVGSLLLLTYFELSLGTPGGWNFPAAFEVRCGQVTWLRSMDLSRSEKSTSPCALVFLFFLVVGNHFTILCWPLPYISMSQPQAHTRPLPPEPLLLLPPHPTPLGGLTALGWAPSVAQQIPTGSVFHT